VGKSSDRDLSSHSTTGDSSDEIELFDREYMHTCRICEPPSSSQSFVPEWENEGGYREKVLKVFENYPPMFEVMIPTGLRARGRKAYNHTTVIYFQAINAEDD
jgi:hypothetical protein